jgi:hypothetical protein
MFTATFRFYEELNDFLAAERRGREFGCPCARAATTKHMIEALGVPHTEVVDHRAHALPVRTLPEHAPADIAHAEPFVAFAHLRRQGRRDQRLVDRAQGRIAVQEQRERPRGARQIVLTRDRELLKRRGVTHGCYVHALGSGPQLREIIDRLAICWKYCDARQDEQGDDAWNSPRLHSPMVAAFLDATAAKAKTLRRR